MCVCVCVCESVSHKWRCVNGSDSGSSRGVAPVRIETPRLKGHILLRLFWSRLISLFYLSLSRLPLNFAHYNFENQLQFHPIFTRQIPVMFSQVWRKNGVLRMTYVKLLA